MLWGILKIELSYDHLVKQKFSFIIDDVDCSSLISTHRFFKEILGQIHFVVFAKD